MSELEKLKAQNAELSDRIAKLEAAAKPPKPVEWVHQPPDYTAGMSMSRSAMQAMIDAVPESVMRGIREDARKPNPLAASQSPITSTSSSQPTSQVQRGTGYRDAVPLGPPPGIEHCDRLVDAQDKIDRAELIERELKLAKMGKGEET
jgi:hypothetical protein